MTSLERRPTSYRPAHGMVADAPAERESGVPEVSGECGVNVLRAGLAGALRLVADRDRDELRHRLGVLALDDLLRHLTIAARPAVVDRVEHEGLLRSQLIQVRADLRV